jgi:hypothetical protein
MARRRNPESQLPYEEWIPCHAVMFHGDGTVDVMTEESESLSNPGERPVINIYGTPGNYTYSLDLSYVGHPGRSYAHHFDKSFRTKEAAEQHARDHIGSPEYGGDFGTVENWRDPIVKFHKYGYEPAGFYALGPGKGARKMNRRNY